MINLYVYVGAQTNVEVIHGILYALSAVLLTTATGGSAGCYLCTAVMEARLQLPIFQYCPDRTGLEHP